MIPFQIIKINAIDSSNNEIKRLYHKKLHKNGLVIWTDNQTNGRGQGSKKWVSQPNKNLTFSVYLDSEYLPLSSNLYLNLITSLCIKKVLICHGIINPVIKWPNDILSVNKKISGILIENNFKSSDLSYSIIGTGINVNQTRFNNLKYATSLKKISGKNIDLDKVLDQLLKNYDTYFKRIHDMRYLSKEFNQNLYGKNKCKFLVKEKIFNGRVERVLDNGNLIAYIENIGSKEFKYSEIKIIY